MHQAKHQNLTEEAKFKMFNNLTLNELMNTANVSDGMKLTNTKIHKAKFGLYD